MRNVKDIMGAIQKLPHQDYAVLRDWICENDWRHWDEQIEADSVSGKLDFLVAEAETQKRDSKLIDL